MTATRPSAPWRSPRTLRPRLGFIGVGGVGRNRLEAIARGGSALVAAIMDQDEALASGIARAHPGARVARSWHELADVPLDGVVIATPSALQSSLALRALERGWAVFCRKPLGRNSTEVRRVVDAAHAADRLLGVDFFYRQARAMRMVRDLVQGGELGRVYAADLVFHNAYGPDKPWFYDPLEAGGGCLMDLGIHLADLLFWILGGQDVSDVWARRFSAGQPLGPGAATVEDYAEVSLQLASGAVARIACSWRLPAGSDAVIEASFYGTRGGATVRNIRGSFRDFTALRFDGTDRQVLCEPPDAWGGRGAVMWTRRLARGDRFDPAARELVRVASLLDRIYAAADAGRGQS